MTRRHALCLLAAVFSLLVLACTTPESLMKRSLVRGSAGEQDAAKELIDYAANGKNAPGLRAWALRSLSRLQALPPESLRPLGELVCNTSEDAQLRSWAAYALGEFRQREAIPYFVRALRGPIDENTGYFVLEGLTKSISMILEDLNLNESVVGAMNAFSSMRGQETPPPMFDLLNEYVGTLPVLVLVLEKEIQAGAKEEALYAAVYRTLVTIEMAKKKMLSAYDRNRKNLEKAVELSLSAVETRYRPLWLLFAWYAGLLGDNPELSSLVAPKLSGWLTGASPRERLVVSWSLARMDLYQKDARDTLLVQSLKKETDLNTLRLMGRLSSAQGEPDKLQQILELRTGK